tara:strand:+ start:318 stop:551 length:234 start_codon:yes stop_codon:yes gene_type:complete
LAHIALLVSVPISKHRLAARCAAMVDQAGDAPQKAIAYNDENNCIFWSWGNVIGLRIRRGVNLKQRNTVRLVYVSFV